jgi:hypothetical protein
MFTDLCPSSFSSYLLNVLLQLANKKLGLKKNKKQKTKKSFVFTYSAITCAMTVTLIAS